MCVSGWEVGLVKSGTVQKGRTDEFGGEGSAVPKGTSSLCQLGNAVWLGNALLFRFGLALM